MYKNSQIKQCSQSVRTAPVHQVWPILRFHKPILFCESIRHSGHKFERIIKIGRKLSSRFASEYYTEICIENCIIIIMSSFFSSFMAGIRVEIDHVQLKKSQLSKNASYFGISGYFKGSTVLQIQIGCKIQQNTKIYQQKNVKAG